MNLATPSFDGVARFTYFKAVCQSVWLAQHFGQIWRSRRSESRRETVDLVCSDLLRHLANWAMTPPAVPTLPSRAHLQDYGRRTTPSNKKNCIYIGVQRSGGCSIFCYMHSVPDFQKQFSVVSKFCQNWDGAKITFPQTGGCM